MKDEFHKFYEPTHTSNKPAKPSPPRSNTHIWVITWSNMWKEETGKEGPYMPLSMDIKWFTHTSFSDIAPEGIGR